MKNHPAARFIITTSSRGGASETAAARELAARLGAPYVARGGRPLAALRAESGAAAAVVLTRRGPVADTAGGTFFFHLSMAELRIKNLENGNDDHMAAAMGLRPGRTVLDCTLGLATDAVVASYLTGARVVGLESSPVAAFIVRDGLRRFEPGGAALREALRRIEVVTADYMEYLRRLPADSFDVVYFDPMFRRPIESSSNLKPLRHIADDRPLAAAALIEARRVAKGRVVVKESKGSREFTRLQLDEICGGKYSSVQYGVLYTGGGD